MVNMTIEEQKEYARTHKKFRYDDSQSVVILTNFDLIVNDEERQNDLFEQRLVVVNCENEYITIALLNYDSETETDTIERFNEILDYVTSFKVLTYDENGNSEGCITYNNLSFTDRYSMPYYGDELGRNFCKSVFVLKGDVTSTLNKYGKESSNTKEDQG